MQKIIDCDSLMYRRRRKPFLTINEVNPKKELGSFSDDITNNRTVIFYEIHE